MENASKALIIAGSILISIIIISLGVVVFRNMSGSVDKNANLDAEERSAFNSRISPYIGENVSGSQVNALIQLARTINQKADEVKKIQINGNYDFERVQTGFFYKVTGEYDENGLLTIITIGSPKDRLV